jgi:DnaJ-class molecular chaperone
MMTHEQEKKLGDDVKPGTDQSGENLCPTCAGKGKVGNKPCPNCGGTGTVTTLVGGGAGVA